MDDKHIYLFLLYSPTLPLFFPSKSKLTLTLLAPNIHSQSIQIPISTKSDPSTSISKTLIRDNQYWRRQPLLNQCKSKNLLPRNEIMTQVEPSLNSISNSLDNNDLDLPIAFRKGKKTMYLIYFVPFCIIWKPITI